MKNKARRRKDKQLQAMWDMHNEVFGEQDRSLHWYGVIVTHSLFVLIVAFMFSRYLK